MFEDLLKDAVDFALSLGANYAEARYQKDVLESIVMKNGVPEVSVTSTDKGIAIRVLVGNSLGFSSTSRLNKASIRKIVKDSISMARAASKIVLQGVSMSDAKVCRGIVKIKPRIKWDSVDLEDKIEYLRDVDRNIVEVSEKMGVKLPSRLLTLEKWDLEKHVLNSDGADVIHIVPRTIFSFLLTLYHPQHGVLQRHIELGESRGWEAVEKWNLVESLKEETENLGNVLIKGVEPPNEEVDVVVGSEVVGLICHESAGHPGEADRVLGREAAQAGETYIKPSMIGTKIGSDLVTVVDDPRIPGSFGYYLYDEEGVEARERVLIEKGLIKELLHNRETAKIFNVESNGSSRASRYDREPIVRMANTYMRPGDYSFQELLEDIKIGVYIKTNQEWNIDDKRWNQRYVGVEAYKIVNGEICEPVRNPVLEITTKEFYSSIDSVGKKISFRAGYCGKGDPMQAIPVWFGGPDVRLRKVRIGRRLT
ncbi:MAG: TldD/PmbA family protein [Aigarchaeota archaeon]|nr:TldD/PmbA family protein [Aigarchaeota archaeon]MCX8193121.1 TldD/PmbA family protein [Nitrososphaeria archaeon]MDW7986744.1 TldD/PmbA family protein [Nitrososphaerota archaeon]